MLPIGRFTKAAADSTVTDNVCVLFFFPNFNQSKSDMHIAKLFHVHRAQYKRRG